jgi:hypothetical protein
MVNSADPTWSAIKLVYNANYMRFKNTNFENKWFYAFIDSIEYINNNCVELFYHLDVIQTWICDWSFNQCMIERCHTPTDAIGQFTYPENVEHGPYVDKQPLTYEYTPSGGAVPGTTNGTFIYTPGIILVSTVAPEGFEQYQIFPGKAGTNCKTFSGAAFYRFGLGEYQALVNLLETLTDEASINSVLEIIMCPLEFFPTEIPANGTSEMTFEVQPLGTLDGYTPRNKKLLCYPYNILYCTNNQGITAEFRNELFNNLPGDNKVFGVWGNIGTNMSMMAYPKNYKGIANNTDEKITVTGFPMCAWKYDSFRAWLAQNAGTITAAGLSLGIEWAKLIANPIAGITSGAMDMSGYVGKHTGIDFTKTGGPSTGLLAATAGAIGQVFDHSRQPPQSKGSTDGSFQYSAGLLTFNFFYKQIKQEYAIILDGYFDMYGYKIMMHGIPNPAVRRCYTFIKTIGCSINANIPAAQTREIESIFDKGIRFWKTNAVFGSFDPNVNNNAV